MVPSVDARKNLTSELLQYVGRKPNIFTEFAVNNLNDAHPRIWWELFGAEIPILQKLAIRILSQPCRASTCEWNWSAFEAAHTKKRNRLEPKNLHSLVFVRMNLHMKKTSKNKELNDTTPISLENINAFEELDWFFYNEGEPSGNSSSASSSSSGDSS
ncbi:hypothetical protein Sango_2486900 [Sesamum angolense]|uniref:HAT C-terminal dimerisation domain-containing protein n=1 Tax=Sesamum angolense TaxID=2727404 RepID=A0AAE2BI20_9LAMI|nr:hypothetical protein Sango_2486900 [Sesamum angolense]